MVGVGFGVGDVVWVLGNGVCEAVAYTEEWEVEGDAGDAAVFDDYVLFEEVAGIEVKISIKYDMKLRGRERTYLANVGP